MTVAGMPSPGKRAVPPALRRAAEAAMRRDPEVLAVVLFGSRARGDRRAGSDWDPAFVTAGGAVQRRAPRARGLPGDGGGAAPDWVRTASAGSTPSALPRRRRERGGAPARGIGSGFRFGGLCGRGVVRNSGGTPNSRGTPPGPPKMLPSVPPALQSSRWPAMSGSGGFPPGRGARLCFLNLDRGDMVTDALPTVQLRGSGTVRPSPP